MTPSPLWRVFPWDPKAADGSPFSPAFVPGGQGRNRFDLPARPRGVLYFADTEEHAVGEMIQGFRNAPDPLTTEDLTAWGHRLALVSATLAPAVWADVADLCEPDTLQRAQVTADLPAYRDRKRTQQIAIDLEADMHAGLRWWSAFWGDWHAIVLFRDRLPPGALTYGRPLPLNPTSPPVVEAARLLDIG
ncbi:MAG: RES family NAD+ phosphorylase [Gemmatimonadota bacterium]